MRIGYKHDTAATYDTQVSAEDPEERVGKLGRVAGMTFASGSTLRSYSAYPAQARLVIGNLPCSPEITFLRPRPGASHRFEKHRNDPFRVAFWEWMDALPKGIDMAFAKGVKVEGVEFDGLRAGGLMLEDPAERSTWKHVTWGATNLASVDELVAPARRRCASASVRSAEPESGGPEVPMSVLPKWWDESVGDLSDEQSPRRFVLSTLEVRTDVPGLTIARRVRRRLTAAAEVRASRAGERAARRAPTR